ncbi:MAG: phage major capsid protein [Minwuia sp.]|nr:phage major capsid protein [Minwuia sp.]
MPQLQEIQNAINGLGTTFEEFKAANDAMQAEIAANGAASTETATKVVNIEAAMAQHEATLTELRDSSDKIFASIDQMNIGSGGRGEAAEKKAAAARQFFARHNAPSEKHRPTDPIGGDFGDTHIDAYANYAKAWLNLIRVNGNVNALPADIQNNLRVGSDTDGGYMVPTEMETTVRERLRDTSPMRSIATVQGIGSDKLTFPYRSDDATSGGWVGEMESRPETGTPQIGEQTIEAFEQYAMPKASQRLLDDAVIDVGGWVMNLTGDKMIRTENAAFVTGNGANKPRGFVDYAAASVTTTDAANRAWGVLQYVPMGADGAFPTSGTADDASALIDMIAALHQGYHAGAVWAMSRLTAAGVRKLKDADGRYLVDFGGTGGLDGGPGFSLHGYSIAQLDDMPAIASDTYPIAFGNFRDGYMIVDRLGMRTLIDPYTTKGQVKFYMTKRVGGDVQNSDAIKFMKAAAT